MNLPRRPQLSCGKQGMGTLGTIINSHVLPIVLFHILIPTGPFSPFIKVFCSHEVYSWEWCSARFEEQSCPGKHCILYINLPLWYFSSGPSWSPKDRAVAMWIWVPLRGVESTEESRRGRESRVDMRQSSFQTQTGLLTTTSVVRKIGNLCVGPSTVGHRCGCGLLS